MQKLPLEVPESYRKGLSAFLRLSRDESASLVEALGTVPLAATDEELAPVLAERAHVDRSKTRAILRMLRSLYGLAARLDLEPADLAAQICSAAEASGRDDLRIDDLPDAVERLATALSVKPLMVALKGQSLAVEHAQRYCTARLVTDIRPVFERDLSAPPTAATLGHTLRVTYHRGDRHEDFFLALDADDIRELRDVLDRALAKEDNLSRLLGQWGVSRLEG